MATINYEQYSLKNGDKLWAVKIRYTDELTGQTRKTTRRGFSTKKAAKIAAERLVMTVPKQNESKYTVHTSDMTVQRVFDLWWESYHQTVEPSTVRTTKKLFDRHILNELGDVQIVKLTSPVIQKWINEQMAQYVQYNKYANYLKRLLDFAVSMDLLTVNPFNKVKVPKRTKNMTANKPKAWDAEDFKKFITALTTTYRQKNEMAFTYLWLISFTGMRRAEALALTWDDIDWHKHTVSINKAVKLSSEGNYIGNPKTAAGNRYLQIDDTTYRVLAEWQSHSNPNHRFIFSQIANDIPVNLSKPEVWFQQAEKFAGVPHITGLHTLRHTFATLAIESGFTPKQVQYQLGHSDTAITMDIYTHITKKASEEIGSKFANSVLDQFSET